MISALHCFQTVKCHQNLPKRMLLARNVFFPRTDDSHSDSIHSSLTAVLFFDDDHVAKQPVA